MNNIKRFLPDALAVVLFIAISFIYFIRPVTQGLTLSGQDHSGGVGAGVELGEYRQRTGERSRWTNVLFSGMPTYQMAPSYDSTDTLSGLQKIYQLGLTGVVMYVFVLLLGFYILLRAFGVKPALAATGAVLWAFSSYFFIIIGAGHLWKVMALAYIPPTLAGLVLCYRAHYWAGGLVTAFFTALQLMSNHVQMTYYFLLVAGLMALAYLIQACKEKKAGQWLKATGVLAVSAAVGIAVNASNLYHTYQYSKQSMRSKSELAYKNKQNPENQTKDGLERDYITQWSYGIGETWTLLVPNAKGGSSNVPMANSKTAMKKADSRFTTVYQALGQYWGEQPGTSGPVYVGAFVLMLFLIGLFIVKGSLKWCMLLATVVSIMLSWGSNFAWFTNLCLDYVPMYDKFRAVASILVIAEFTIPLLAALALKEMLDNPDGIKQQRKYILISFLLTGGVALLFWLFPQMFFTDFVSSSENAMLEKYIPGDVLGALTSNLREMRVAVFRADAFRSFLIIAIGTALLALYYYKKIKPAALVAGVFILCLFDLWQVDKRYLNDGMFSEPRLSAGIAKTQTDELILRDTTYYRVLNLASNTFNENNTSYYHKSIGGYNAAKLRRYQEMIEEHIVGEMNKFARTVIATKGNLTDVPGDSLFPVLNMLNMKYAIMSASDNQTVPVFNPHADGNGWFVRQLTYVETADEEILGLHKISPKATALVNSAYKDALKADAGAQPYDSTSYVRLTAYDANALSYEICSQEGGIVVFSDIFYPGWQANIDGEPADIACADYILRAINVPAGRHAVNFKFDPQSLHVTEAIANTALILLMLSLLAYAVRAVLRRRKAKVTPQEKTSVKTSKDFKSGKSGT